MKKIIIISLISLAETWNWFGLFGGGSEREETGEPCTVTFSQHCTEEEAGNLTKTYSFDRDVRKHHPEIKERYHYAFRRVWVKGDPNCKVTIAGGDMLESFRPEDGEISFCDEPYTRLKHRITQLITGRRPPPGSKPAPPPVKLSVKGNDSEIVKYLAKNPLPVDEPVPIEIFFTSECPYSQDFMTRHMVSILGDGEVPIDVTLRTSMLDKWDKKSKCQPTPEKKKLWSKDNANGKEREAACHSNLALLCAWNSPSMDIKDPSYRTKVSKFTDEMLNTMQQWNFQPSLQKKGNAIVEDVAKKFLDWNVLTECMTGSEGESLAQASLDAWPQAKERAEKKFKGKISGKFPWVFLEDLQLQVDHGVVSDPRFHTITQLVCIAEPTVKGCKKELKKMHLLEDPPPKSNGSPSNKLWLAENVSVSQQSWLVSMSLFLIILALFLVITAYGSWIRSAGSRARRYLESDHLLERDQLEMEVIE